MRTRCLIWAIDACRGFPFCFGGGGWALGLGAIGMAAAADAPMSNQPLAPDASQRNGAMFSTQSAGTSRPYARQAVPAAFEGTGVDLPAAETQLAAIRRAVIDRLMRGPTKVLSLAWIDNSGALHETSQFSAQAQVRGIRVLGYLEEAGGQAKPKFDAQVEVDLADSMRGAAGSSECTSDVARRVPLLVEVAVATGLRGQDAGAAQWIAQHVQHHVRSATQHLRRWVGVHVSGSGDQQTSPYRRALLGVQPDRPAWRLHFVLDADTVYPLPPETVWAWGRAVLRRDAGPTPVWRVHMSLRRGASAAPVYEASHAVPMHASSSDGRSDALTTFTRLLPEWLEAVDAQATCQPVEFGLEADGAGRWHLPWGAHSGFRVGDRVVVVDRRHVPQRILEPGAIALMVLAEVRQVASHRVVLQQIAGPSLPADGEWVALPI